MTLFILIVLTALGIFIITTVTTDIKITGITREYEDAFYTADSGVPIGAEVTALALGLSADEASDLPLPWNNEDVIRILIQESGWPTIEMERVERLEQVKVPGRLDIVSQGLTRYHIAGGAIEFGRGYMPVGGGQETGGVGILFKITSKGRYRGSTSEIEAYYRYVVGVPGG